LSKGCILNLSNPLAISLPFGVYVVPIGSRDGIYIQRSVGVKILDICKTTFDQSTSKPFMAMSSHAPSKV